MGARDPKARSVPTPPLLGTDLDMLDFDLDMFYPMMASDEGPPFGRESGITTDGLSEKMMILIRMMIRLN